jgi:hypothetical protein
MCVMKIKVKDPRSGKLLGLEANPCSNNQEKGWSVTLPAGNNVFITLKNNEWKVRHNEMVSSDLVKAIGKGIPEDIN